MKSESQGVTGNTSPTELDTPGQSHLSHKGWACCFYYLIQPSFGCFLGKNTFKFILLPFLSISQGLCLPLPSLNPPSITYSLLCTLLSLPYPTPTTPITCHPFRILTPLSLQPPSPNPTPTRGTRCTCR
jgi:hypothetical protein